MMMMITIVVAITFTSAQYTFWMEPHIKANNHNINDDNSNYNE